MNIKAKIASYPLLVTAAAIIADGKVLITRRPDHKPHGGFWEFPGGKIDPGESPEEALKRELNEELDVSIEVKEIIDALYHRYDSGAVLLLAYHCVITQGKPRNIEVSEHRWVPIPELHNFNLLPADIPLISKLQSFPC